MRPQVILKYIGLVLLFNSAFLLLSALISYFNGVDDGFSPLLLSSLLVFVMGVFPQIFVGKSGDISSKESYVIIVGSWLLLCLVGMFPYLLYGGEFNLVKAWFESVSGFTTTGASILNNIEALPKGLLFWRSATHFIGGLGVVMFVFVIAPSLGKSRNNLTNVELSSFAKEQYHYRTSKIMRILLGVYVGLCVAEVLCLRIVGMNWFDAVAHSFSTIATGGFSTRNASIASFNSLRIEMVVCLFMLLSGIHLGLIFATVTGKRNNIFRSDVARYFLLSMVVAILIMTIDLTVRGTYDNFFLALRHASFQLVNMATSTGFATDDSSLWPPLSILIIMLFTIQGGCAGSTAGGLKCDRVCLIFKSIARQIKHQQHPRAVIRIKLGGIIQDDAAVSYALLFGMVFILAIVVGTVVNLMCGVDLMTGFSAALSSMADAGPGFGLVGSFSNFSVLPDVSKITMTLLMLLGRLEIFGLIQFFVIGQWR